MGNTNRPGTLSINSNLRKATANNWLYLNVGNPLKLAEKKSNVIYTTKSDFTILVRVHEIPLKVNKFH